MIVARSAKHAAQKAGLKETGCVVTIGNFDGVHLGHQHMLMTALGEARARKIPLLVMSFDPHPADYFSPAMAPARLNNLIERVIALHDFGANIACIMPFNAALARMSHKTFTKQILHEVLNAKCVVIGDDFRYGQGRVGNAKTLLTSGQALGFDVLQLDSVMKSGQRASSTAIRAFLEAGALEQAADVLGRRYTMIGRVLHGEKRGRTWGFPTLNLAVRKRRALKGVFAVQVRGLGSETYHGVANLGSRPTVDGLKTLLEVHLFDFDAEVYGQRVCVEFHAQIRQEKKFDSFEALKTQIGLDVLSARQHFKDHQS